MAKFCRTLSRRVNISEAQSLDDLELADLWDAAAKEQTP